MYYIPVDESDDGFERVIYRAKGSKLKEKFDFIAIFWFFMIICECIGKANSYHSFGK